MVDVSYTESWASQPDVCRCCMSASGTWDVTVSYITETGENEVYSEMLQECFGITLSYLLHWGHSRMVCGLCVGHLREALRFRKQVLQAEQQFCRVKNSRTFKPVVLKVDTPRKKSDSDSSDNEDSDDRTIDVLTLTNTTARPVVDRLLPKSRSKSKKRKKEDVDENLDSDTPISEISKKNHPSKSINDNDSLERSSVDSSDHEPVRKLKKEPVLVAKHLIKNRDLRMNITLLLKYTTILPFKFINNTQYYCHYCDDPYLLFKDLKNHVKVSHLNLSEKQIHRTIRVPKNLVKADISDISCRLCGSSYNTIEKIAEHLTVLHDKKYTVVPGLKNWHGILGLNMSSSKLKCHICDEQFRFFKNLSSHMNEHSSDYVCHICGQRFSVEHRLLAHVHRHRRRNTIVCKFCKKVFKSASARKYHIHKEHEKIIKYNCPECSEEFLQYPDRLKHMVERHKFKKPEFRCPHCSKLLGNPSALASHIRYLHFKNENKNIICEICGKAFYDNWLLKRHVLAVHAGEKSFECEYCKKKFAKKYTLKTHLKIHLNEKNYVCTVCNAAFVQKCSLKTHLKAYHKEIDISTL